MSFTNEFNPNFLTQAHSNQSPEDLCATMTESIIRFIEESCLIGSAYKVRSDLLYIAYEAWYEVNEMPVEMSPSIFENELLMQGFQYVIDGQFHGLGLLDREVDDCDDYIECVFDL